MTQWQLIKEFSLEAVEIHHTARCHTARAKRCKLLLHDCLKGLPTKLIMATVLQLRRRALRIRHHLVLRPCTQHGVSKHGQQPDRRRNHRTEPLQHNTPVQQI